MFDFSTGTLTIDASTNLFHGGLSPDDRPLIGAMELAKYGEWENYGVKNVTVGGKPLMWRFAIATRSLQ